MGRLAYSMSADQPLRGVPIREGDLWHLSTEERETARAVDAGSFGAVGLGGGRVRRVAWRGKKREWEVWEDLEEAEGVFLFGFDSRRGPEVKSLFMVPW